MRGYMCAKSLQLCPTLMRPYGLQPARLFCPWVLQARILEWMAISFSRGSSQPRDQTRVLGLLALAGGFFTTSATCEPLPWTPVQIQFTAEVSVQMVVKFICHKVKFSLPKVPGRLPAFAYKVRGLNSGPSGSASCSISWCSSSLLQNSQLGYPRMPAVFPCKLSQCGKTQNGSPQLFSAQPVQLYMAGSSALN